VSRYRLLRRTREVSAAIRKEKGSSCGSILDIGTADGMMLSLLQQSIIIRESFGLDLSTELLKTNTNQSISLVQGDALSLPFKDCSFDIVIGAAVIEHVPDPRIMIREIKRVLKRDGICVITTPHPFFDSIARRIGHLPRENHISTYKLWQLTDLLSSVNLKTLTTRRFMLSPIGSIPFEDELEQAIRTMRLSFLMCNQIIVSRK